VTDRKIVIPGVAIDVTTIISSTNSSKNSVLALPHRGEVIVVFFSREQKPSARAMSDAQARQFVKDLTFAHQAFSDDAKIAQMERDFTDEE